MQTETASIHIEQPPRILQAASIVGTKKAEAPSMHLAFFLQSGNSRIAISAVLIYNSGQI